ncbi:hypothetical protein BYT27DRAFT_7261112 [Phlegmacium glaucopus]|nr:hypothetical protein BYT27DRAFT_7261112 [Phlegmacium glaucopus]
MDTQNVDNLASGQQQQGQHVGPRLHGGYRVRQYQGKQYIVPDFLAPSTEQALAAIDAREQVNAMNTTYESSSTIAAGLVKTPLDPSLTEQEASLLHVEIQALAQKLGLSYKDAAHRLYMAEIERLKMADSAAKSFSALKHRMDKIVSHELYPPISAIDGIKHETFSHRKRHIHEPFSRSKRHLHKHSAADSGTYMKLSATESGTNMKLSATESGTNMKLSAAASGTYMNLSAAESGTYMKLSAAASGTYVPFSRRKRHIHDTFSRRKRHIQEIFSRRQQHTSGIGWWQQRAVSCRADQALWAVTQLPIAQRLHLLRD